MYGVEFLADKIPGVDAAWDAIHSFIRIPAGAVLAAAAVGELSLAMALVGGGMAAGAHATKAGMRAFLNLSPEPVTNWTASISEDAMVIGGVWAALHQPWLFLVFLALFVAAAIWILPKIGRWLRSAYCSLRGRGVTSHASNRLTSALAPGSNGRVLGQLGVRQLEVWV